MPLFVFFLSVVNWKTTTEGEEEEEGGGMLMATDSLESLGQELTIGNNFYISLSPGTREDADRIFSGLSEGGKVEMQMTDMFWGYFGCFADKFGVQWMLNVGNNQPN